MRSPDAPLAAEGRSDQVHSLVRALRILNRLASVDEGQSLTEIGHALELPPSTAHRLLTTLEQEGYAHFDAHKRLWSVGLGAFVAGNGFLRSRSLVGIARPMMRALMEHCGETVNLAEMEDAEITYLAQVECRQVMRALARPGARVPVHCSGVGKAILSALSPDAIGRLLGKRSLRRATPRTLTTLAAIRGDARLARARGFAVDDEEQAVGLRCVASPIFNEAGEPVAAISVSGPAARIVDARVVELGRRVRETADAVTCSFGGALPAWRRRLPGGAAADGRG